MSEVCCPIQSIKDWWATTPELQALFDSSLVNNGELKDPDPAIKSYTSIIQSVSKVS